MPRPPRSSRSFARDKPPRGRLGGPPRREFPGKLIFLNEGKPQTDLSRAVDRVRLIVADGEAARLDHFLSRKMPWRSRTDFRRMIESGEVTVGHQIEHRSSRKVRPGQMVELAVPPPPENLDALPDIAIVTIYEDDDLLVLNKDGKTLVHPVGRKRYINLLSALHYRYRGQAADVRTVHRLDQQTSGVILFTKRVAARGPFQTQFEQRETRKTYLAIVHGAPESDEFAVDLPIGPRLNSEIRLAMGIRRDEAGLPSCTEVTVRERFARFSLVECRPITGRQHQIRVHLEAVGHPVLCDHLYGRETSVTAASLCADGAVVEDPGATLLNRHALHAARLEIVHPFKRRVMSFEAPLPDDMGGVLATLRGL